MSALRLALLWIVLLALFFCTMRYVLAQHNHERGHNDYLGWSSAKVNNCCNNDDCGILDETDLRETPAGTEINISGQWCPVEPRHYLIRGKSPDWNAAHACIRKTPIANQSPCERLLCFAGRGGV